MPHSTCENCGKEIKVLIFRGGSYCSELCHKALIKTFARPLPATSPNGRVAVATGPPNHEE